jgi:hypothetical protein
MQGMARIIRTKREQWNKGDTWLGCREKAMFIYAESRCSA